MKEQFEMEKKLSQLEQKELQQLQKQVSQSSREHHHQQLDGQLFAEIHQPPQLKQSPINNTSEIIIAEIQQPPSQQPQININDFKDGMYQIFHQLHDDYDAVKYLVDQHITTQEQYNHKLTEINLKQQELEHLESKFHTFQQFQSKLQQLETTVLDDINSRQAEKQSQVKKESEQLKEQQRVQKITQLAPILKSNHQLTEDMKTPYPSFQFENLPGVKHECGSWDNPTLYKSFYFHLVSDYLSHHLKPLKSTIKQSKLFISSKSVLDGEWIQIQGDGAVLDMSTETLYSFIEPGDESIPYTECDEHCTMCKGKGFDGNKAKLRHLIKFKWE